jgi:hypothetical protein
VSLQRDIENKLGVPGSSEPEVEIKLYVGTDKDDNWYKLESDAVLVEANLSEAAKRNFVYSGYEVALEGTVNVRTGKFRCHSVNGVKLERPIEA